MMFLCSRWPNPCQCWATGWTVLAQCSSVRVAFGNATALCLSWVYLTSLKSNIVLSTPLHFSFVAPHLWAAAFWQCLLVSQHLVLICSLQICLLTLGSQMAQCVTAAQGLPAAHRSDLVQAKDRSYLADNRLGPAQSALHRDGPAIWMSDNQVTSCHSSSIDAILAGAVLYEISQRAQDSPEVVGSDSRAFFIHKWQVCKFGACDGPRCVDLSDVQGRLSAFWLHAGCVRHRRSNNSERVAA
jgi:hypothetical protein